MKKSFEEELRSLLNRYSLENDSNTPDFLLASYLVGCLENYKNTIDNRDKWFGFKFWDDDNIG